MTKVFPGQLSFRKCHLNPDSGYHGNITCGLSKMRKNLHFGHFFNLGLHFKQIPFKKKEKNKRAMMALYRSPESHWLLCKNDHDISKERDLCKVHTKHIFKTSVLHIWTMWPSFWPEMTYFQVWLRSHQDTCAQQFSWWWDKNCDLNCDDKVFLWFDPVT